MKQSLLSINGKQSKWSKHIFPFWTCFEIWVVATHHRNRLWCAAFLLALHCNSPVHWCISTFRCSLRRGNGQKCTRRGSIWKGYDLQKLNVYSVASILIFSFLHCFWLGKVYFWQSRAALIRAECKTLDCKIVKWEPATYCSALLSEYATQCITQYALCSVQYSAVCRAQFAVYLSVQYSVVCSIVQYAVHRIVECDAVCSCGLTGAFCW